MGNSNMAARRGAKANRRKAILAQKRQVGALGETKAGLVARAAATPILHCLLTPGLFETGMGNLLVARGVAIGQPVLGVFLLDVFCLGVKDVILRTAEGHQVRAIIDRLSAPEPMIPVDPSYARKLLHDLVQWSGTLGIQPHQDYAVAERLFGDADPRACGETFEFGYDGKPLYVSGPGESQMLVRQRINQLTRRLGADGFHSAVPLPGAGF